MPSARTSISPTHSPRPRTPARKPTVPAQAPRANRNAVLLGGLVLVVALVGGILFFTTGEDDGPGSTGSNEAGIAHVHGLGVDPKDGALYVGTHVGLFRVSENGAASLVAGRVQDFMGFTVVGPGHFLASGHPGAGQGGPGSLGLIESTDGGQTWQSLSLAGEADFHSLEARHGLVYGLNSLTGEFMVSQDGQTWDTRSQIPMADFAVSPDDPEVVLATTEQGLMRSDDGGRIFEPVAASPVLLLVTWADATIVGVEPDGTVHASADDGQSWQQRGSLDAAPQALAATDAGEVFAAVEGAILASSDGGRSFTVRYTD